MDTRDVHELRVVRLALVQHSHGARIAHIACSTPIWTKPWRAAWHVGDIATARPCRTVAATHKCGQAREVMAVGAMTSEASLRRPRLSLWCVRLHRLR